MERTKSIIKLTSKRENSGFALRFLFALFVLVWFGLTFFSSGFMEAEDGWLYASVARNIYYNRVFESSPDNYPINNVHMNTSKDANGKWRSLGSYGYSLSLVPAIALADVVHRIYKATPPQYFPLENDWAFHLFGSMTNTFWGAVITIVMILYLFALGFSKKESILYGLITLFGTYLFTLTKFSFAHLTFLSFVLISFYCIKRYTQTYQFIFLFFAFLSYIAVIFAYNVSYYLPIFPLILYLFLLLPRKGKLILLSVLAIVAIVSLLFFRNQVNILFIMTKVSPKVLFEGVWGFLFSPGKSLFLYTPPLLLLPMFWHKLSKKMFPEILSFCLLLVFYLYYMGSPWIGDWDRKMPIWHGGMDWGPRYISATIPFLMILVFLIIKKLSTLQKRLIVVPLFILSIFIQTIGTANPYILQYKDIPYNIYIGRAELTYYDYASFIPRYTPLWAMTRELIEKLKNFPQTLSHGKYNVRFFDGFELPLYTPFGYFRGFREQGYISFTNNSSNKIRSIAFTLEYSPESASSSSSIPLKIFLNNSLLDTLELSLRTELPYVIDTSKLQNLPQISSLVFIIGDGIHHETPQQTVYIKSLHVNEEKINLASLDYPEISTIGYQTAPGGYKYFGNIQNDRWQLWHLRHRVFGQTLDYWWIRSLYFWDRPKNLLLTVFTVNLLICISSGWYVAKHYKSMYT